MGWQLSSTTAVLASFHSRLSKYTEGVARRIATRRSNQECEEVPRYSLQINDDVCGFHPVLYATHLLIFHVHADEKITPSCVEKCRVANWLPCRDHTCRLQLLLRLVTPSALALSNFRSFYFHFRIRSEHSKYTKICIIRKFPTIRYPGESFASGGNHSCLG